MGSKKNKKIILRFCFVFDEVVGEILLDPRILINLNKWQF